MNGMRALGDGLVALAALGMAGLALVSACTTHEIPTNPADIGEGTDDEDDDDGGLTTEDLPSCTFASGLGADASGVTFTFGRTFLECDVGSGTEACLSADPTTCPDHGSSVMGGTTISCEDQCDPTFYAVVVALVPVPLPDGGFAEPTTPTLPSTCELASENPGADTTYCCPCNVR